MKRGSSMEVKITNYFQNNATGAQNDIAVSLTDTDGQKLFKFWDSLSSSQQIDNLTIMADIYCTNYAIKRGLRSQEQGSLDISNMMKNLHRGES